MGQKVNPNGLRIGIIKNWESKWIAKDNKQTAQWIVEDDDIRKRIFKRCKAAQVSSITIERQQGSITIFVHCSQPGIVYGKESANLNVLKKDISLIVGRKTKVFVNVIELENPALSARIVAREIADAIENRVSFRNAQKLAIKKVLAAGAKGIKTHVSGRLGGVEMAREEGYSEGVVPLTTLRADIDYAVEEALTTYGLIGVKVWINRGEIFERNFNIVKPNFKKDRNDRDRNFNKDRKQQQNRNENFVRKQVEKPAPQPVVEQKVEEPVDPELLKREQEQLKVVETTNPAETVKETSIIMISTKPEYANIILGNKEKNVFFYKVTPVNEVKRVLIYATAPVQAVVGEFDLEKIHIVAPSTAWSQHGANSCLNKKEFDEYFKGHDKAHALIANKTFRYRTPRKLSDFNMKKGPSGFQYLK